MPAGGVVHVKHLDDRTLPVQLTEIVHPGYERRIPGEVGAGCRCHVVQKTTTVAAWGATAWGSADYCGLSPCRRGFRLQTHHAGQLLLLQ